MRDGDPSRESVYKWNQTVTNILHEVRFCFSRRARATPRPPPAVALAHSRASATLEAATVFFPAARIAGGGAHLGATPVTSHSSRRRCGPPAAAAFAIERWPPPICGALVCVWAGRTVVADRPPPPGLTCPTGGVVVLSVLIGGCVTYAGCVPRPFAVVARPLNSQEPVRIRSLGGARTLQLPFIDETIFM